MKRGGFTLIELLVVISIISLLSSIVYGSLAQARAKARNAERNSYIIQYRNALELYAGEHEGLYPLDDNMGSITPVSITGHYCLGDYTGYTSGNGCGMSNSDGSNDYGVANPTLKTLLSPYLSSFPPVSKKLIKWGTVSGRNYWLGATYYCSIHGGLPDSRVGCPHPDVEWYLEDPNQSCVGGAVATNQPSTSPTATRCILAF